MSVPVVRPVKSRTRSVNQKVVFTSHVEELSNLALKLGFECPDYSSIERVTRGKRVFMGKVKVSCQFSVLISSFLFICCTEDMILF